MRARVGVLLLLAACSAVPEIPQSSQGRFDALVARLESEIGRQWTDEDLAGILGEPVSRSDSGTMAWYGLEVALEASSVVRVTLTDARYTLSEGIRVGHTEGHVRSILGPPIAQSDDTWTYETERGAQLQIHLELGRVTKLTRWYGGR